MSGGVVAKDDASAGDVDAQALRADGHASIGDRFQVNTPAPSKASASSLRKRAAKRRRRKGRRSRLRTDSGSRQGTAHIRNGTLSLAQSQPTRSINGGTVSVAGVIGLGWHGGEVGHA